MKFDKKKLIGYTLVGICSTLLTGCSPTFNREVKNNDIMGSFSSSVFKSQEQRRQEREEREKQKAQQKAQEEKKKEDNEKDSKEYKWGADRAK